MAISDNLKRGTIEISVLSLLKQKDMYGYEISQELSNQSNGLYTIQETSLYPSLYRLLEKGCISDRTEKVGKRRTRVYYHLEPEGEVYLDGLRKEYLSTNRGVLYLLGINSLEEMENE